jgi:hypothetical protein
MFKAYMQRHANARQIGRHVTVEDIARIHNGGPKGWKKTPKAIPITDAEGNKLTDAKKKKFLADEKERLQNLEEYWAKVKIQLIEQKAD